jgi:SAM-dependent methyltransferase
MIGVRRPAVNAVELYLLGQKLMRIGREALPEDSGLRRLPPSARLVLADAISNLGTSADQIARRTGLPQDHVSAQVSRLADDGFLEVAAGAAGDQRIIASRRLPLREAAARPADEAIAAALGTEDTAQAAELVAVLESLARRLDVGAVLRRGADFDAAYAGTPPWDIGRPQPAFAELAGAGAIRGRVLDVGCGTGEHALMAADLGLPALGVDVSPTAIGIAARKARERGRPARFMVHDALDLAALSEQFDTVLDCGLFHIFSNEDRRRYADSLRAVIAPGGRYFMLCFSDRQPAGFGPRRVSREEIESTFADGWRVEAIDPATLEVTVDPDGVRAWRAAIVRTRPRR